MEDYIDFPVSDDWLDFYHRQGLTPRHSPNYYNNIPSKYLERIATLETENLSLKKRIERLEEELEELKKRPFLKKESGLKTTSL